MEIQFARTRSRPTVLNRRRQLRSQVMRQFMDSLTAEQRLMLREACTNGPRVEKILTRLVALLTPELLEQIDANAQADEG